MQAETNLSFPTRLRLAATFAGTNATIEVSFNKEEALRICDRLEHVEHEVEKKADAALRAIRAQNAMALIERHEIKVPMVIGFSLGVLAHTGIVNLINVTVNLIYFVVAG